MDKITELIDKLEDWIEFSGSNVPVVIVPIDASEESHHDQNYVNLPH